MRIRDFQDLTWSDAVGGQPLIAPPFFSPIIADPAVVPPTQSPDGRWHLFAHSALGIHHHESADGLHWEAQGLAVWHGMRASVLRYAGAWWLYYEEYPAFGLSRTALPEALHTPWHSWISRRRSVDLIHWSDAEPVLAPTLPWQRSRYGSAVGNPCVVQMSETSGPQKWALYYSGGLVFIPDCGFTEPSAIGRATAPSPEGPWTIEPTPLLVPDAKDPAMNLSAGSIKVLRASDGFVGFQNAITWVDGHSTSAIYLLWSVDGRQWTRAAKPVLAPGSLSWRRSHVYACDVRFDAKSSSWWMFYNARDNWHISKGKEAIGALRAPSGYVPRQL